MEKLKFLRSWTVPEFKSEHQVSKIEIKQNPLTGKCFFVYGCESGACSEKLDKEDIVNPIISEVCSPLTGDTFLLLHKSNEGGAPTLAVL